MRTLITMCIAVLLALQTSVVPLVAASSLSNSPTPLAFTDVVPLSDAAFDALVVRLLKIEQEASPGFPHVTEGFIWQTTANGGWTGGFYPGLLWLASEEAERRGSPLAGSLRTKASLWSLRLSTRISDTSLHDLGFLFMPTWVEAYKQTGNDMWRQGALRAADSLTKRYTPGGFIQSWGKIGQGPYAGTVIIDNMMNLELLYWATQASGITSYAKMANSHALLTQASHVRADGGTYHLVDFNRNTGEMLRGRTSQGLHDESTWSRGQAWGIAGFATAFRYSGNSSFLQTAGVLANYFLEHLPEDGVAPWDFQAGPQAAKDTSASAIAAYGLLLVAQSLEAQGDGTAAATRAAQARQLLEDLHPYSFFARPGEQGGLLLGGTYNFKKNMAVEQSVIWGDFYYLRSLLALAQWEEAH